MEKRQFLLSIVAAASLLAGCATPIGKDSFINYKPVNIQSADIMPAEADLQVQQLKVVVNDADVKANSWARDAELAGLVAKSIESTIGASGVEIVDDALATKLTDVLKLAEADGRATYSGPKIANFAIRSTVTDARYGATYNPASTFTDKKGKSHYNPPSYSHSASVKINIRIYEIPSLKLMHTINANGSASFSDGNTGANQGTGRGLVQSAAQDAIKSAAPELRKEFAPTGYIDSKRSDGKRSIFSVTLGSQNGLKPGSKVDIYDVQRTQSGFGNAQGTEEVLVAKGIVTEMVERSKAWIQVDDDAATARVMRGNRVRPDYVEKGLFGF
jgi:hypothetical protein